MHIMQGSKARAAAFTTAVSFLALGCGEVAQTPAADGGVNPNTPDTAVDAGPAITASCVYTNAFSRREECRDYIDPAWTETTASADCTTARGTFRMGSSCSFPSMLGSCEIRVPNVRATRISFPGSDASQCMTTRTGCTVFARGSFTPAGVCVAALGDGGVTAPSDASASGLGVFQPAVRECRDARAGEAPGRGPNGQVCTWAAVAGSTEEGRRFEDYASCERVRTQRPYYPYPAGQPRGNDARLQNPTYAAELAWVRSQVEASACVCCHSRRATPEGPSNWYLEAPGNWIDSFYDTGLALGAGWIDSRALGAYPASENNGFARTTSGIPSTDPARMARFFEQELAHRGRTRASFANATPFGGPIYDQLVYAPSRCTNGEGVRNDQTIQWTGGAARYLYVLDQGSENPGVPPNLDLPMGTRWRLDIPPTGTPMASGIRYGQVPTGATQRFPANGAPAALVPGATYYLYVLADVGVPLTRCLFTFSG